MAAGSKPTSLRKILLSATMIATSAIVVTPAFAQEGGQETAAVSDEIVVTAERRATSLQQTPLSIKAFNDEMLAEKNISNVEDLANFVPGLSVGGETDGGSVRPIFIIRGIGQSSGRDTIERGVGLYVDDIFLPRATGSLLQLIDVERVEVLRGPQGTLFGRNSTGGAIRYITRKPERDEFMGRVRATYGSFDRVDVDGLANIPLGDNMAVRLQAASFNRDGYLKGAIGGTDRGDQDDLVLRGTLRYWLGDSVTIDLGATYQHAKQFAPALKPIAFNPNSAFGRAINGYYTARGMSPLVTDDPRIVNSDFYKWNDQCFIGDNAIGIMNADNIQYFGDKQSYCDYGVDQRNTVGFIDINAELSPELSLRSLTGITKGKAEINSDWSATGAGNIHEISKDRSFSQEIQLAYDLDRIHVVGGGIFFSELPYHTNQSSNLQYFPLPPLGINFGDCCVGFVRYRDAKSTSYGLFTQATFDITDQLSLVLGGRYSYDKKELTAARSNRFGGVPRTNSGSWSSWDYRATLQYDVLDNLMVYGTYSTGYKAGGFNDTLATNPNAPSGGILPYDPEDVASMEFGFRSQWFDNRLTLNTTYFHTKYKDLQLVTPQVFTDPVTLQFFNQLLITNGGNINLSGFEIDGRLRPVDNFSIDFGVSTLHQDYKSLLDGSALLVVSTCTDPTAPTFATCDAQPLARAPKLQFNVGATLDTPFQGGNIVWSTAYSWTDSQFSSNADDNSWLIPSYGVMNLRAEFTPDDGRWSLAAYGTNILGNEYYTSGADFGAFFGSITAAPGRPAEWGVTAKVNF